MTNVSQKMTQPYSSTESKIAQQDMYWFCTTFRIRKPQPLDLYVVAKKQYEQGFYHVAVKCMEMYISRKARLTAPPMHLLGYCHLKNGSLLKAKQCFLAAVHLGFDLDWQSLVQVALDLEAEKEAEAAKEEEERERALLAGVGSALMMKPDAHQAHAAAGSLRLTQ